MYTPHFFHSPRTQNPTSVPVHDHFPPNPHNTQNKLKMQLTPNQISDQFINVGFI